MAPQQAGATLANRPWSVAIAAAIDDWANLRFRLHEKREDPSWRRLVETAILVDPDPWRNEIRATLGRDGTGAVETLRRLASTSEVLESRSTASLRLLAVALLREGDSGAARTVLEAAWRRSPSDYAILFELGTNAPHQPDRARFLTAAVAVRPEGMAAYNNLGVVLRDLGRADEALAALREAIRLEPDLAGARNNFGNALSDLGRTDEALAAYREAIRLEPDHAEAHCNLGAALTGLGRADEALAAYREAIRLEPDYAEAHCNLGAALTGLGRADEALAAYREAIRLEPDYAEAHCNLGLFLLREGDYDEAVVELRRGHELGSRQPFWSHPSAEWVRQAEQLSGLVGRLPAVLSGEETVGGAELVQFALLCYQTRRYGTMARLAAEAFDAEPELADDLASAHRYNAACGAALAGAGKGEDDPPLDDEARAGCRRQAVAWLRSDLEAWAERLDAEEDDARQVVLKTLRHWEADPDLAGIRDEGPLATLPEDERDECQALWAEVAALIERAESMRP